MKKKSVLLIILLVVVIQNFAASQTSDGSSTSKEDTGIPNSDGNQKPSESKEISVGSQSVEEASRTDIDSIGDNITYLNAANFNFEESLGGNYLGKLNIFAPNINKTRWGFNTGIMRVRFTYSDTTRSAHVFENRLINPLDSILVGKQYLREFNRYTSGRSNTTWSFYVQPLFRINPWTIPNQVSSSQSYIYLHAHFELLVHRTNINTSISNLARDTFLLTERDLRRDFRFTEEKVITTNQTILSGYFGGGITFDLVPFGNENSRFFLQPTFGVTTNYPHWGALEISAAEEFDIGQRPSTRNITNSYRSYLEKAGLFYLIRAEFIQKLSKNSQIIIGTDIRGLFPSYSPLYAAFIGLNININSLAKILTDK